MSKESKARRITTQYLGNSSRDFIVGRSLTKLAEAAEQVKKEYGSWETAKAALIGEFAQIYKAPTMQDDDGNLVFVPSNRPGVYAGTGNAANQALKRVLMKAFGSARGK